MSSPTLPARIPGYGLAAPGEPDARAALERVFGPDKGAQAWSAACRAAGATGPVDTVERLERVVQALAAQGGAVATVARSLEIRIRTHARLAALATRSAATKAGATA